MSDTQDLVDLFSGHIGGNCHIVAMITLGVYDWILTLGRERQYIWRSATSNSSILFLVIRYSSLATVPFTMIMNTYFTGKSDQVRTVQMHGCSITERMDMVLDILVLSAAAVYSAIRVYAIWGRRRWLLVLVLVLGMMNPFITSCLFVVSLPSAGPPPFLDCGYDINVSEILYGRASSIVADTLVIVATWVRIWPMRKNITNRKLTGVMVTDGSLYFFVLLGANVVALALVGLELTYLFAQWISCFTVIFTCRFILDLHEAAAASSVAMPVATRPRALPRPDSSVTQFSSEDSGPTLPVAKHASDSMPKLNVSFGSMSIFGAMIPYIGRGEFGEGDTEIGDTHTGSREKELFLGHRTESEDVVGEEC